MKKILKVVPLVVLFLILVVVTVAYKKANTTPYPNVKADSTIPQYEEAINIHKHNYDGANYLPVIGSAAIDINNDGISELFLGGGIDQDDAIYSFEGGKFVKIESISFNKIDKDVTYGATVADFNNDGKDDLLLARESGGHLYYNKGGNSFTHKKIDLKLNQKSRPISFGIGDLNNDGHLDLFVSAYLTRHSMEGQNIFNKKNYGGTSLLLLNNGDDTFTDISKESGLGNYTHNAFMGIFVDMDDDLDLDLVVAHDTGTVKTWKNLGNLKFEDSTNPFSDVLGYPMGIGAGDYNNDGLIDFYFSNIGDTAPAFLAKGDITDDQTFFTKLMLMENKGNMEFVDSAEKTKLADYEFSWGAVIADLNLDSKQDIILSESYVDFPLHKLFKLPGRVLLQNTDSTFASIEEQTKTENRNYEIAPLLADFNNDGYPDQVRVNIDGETKIFISKAQDNKYLKVKLPSNAKFMGSKVEVDLSNGSKLYDWQISGEGLGSDQEHVLTFGLGKELTATNITVKTLDGSILTKRVENKNQTVIFN